MKIKKILTEQPFLDGGKTLKFIFTYKRMKKLKTSINTRDKYKGFDINDRNSDTVFSSSRTRLMFHLLTPGSYRPCQFSPLQWSLVAHALVQYRIIILFHNYASLLFFPSFLINVNNYFNSPLTIFLWLSATGRILLTLIMLHVIKFLFDEFS